MRNILNRNQIGALIIALIIAPSIAFAEEKEDKNPLGCRDLGYKFHLQALDILPEDVGDRQSLYFLFNRTSTPLRLHQMRGEQSPDGMSINHDIPPQQWSVLAVNAKLVRYACTKLNKDSTYGELVDCAQSVKVCEFARVKFGLNNRGNFWMVNGNSKNGALYEVTYYGVIAR